MPATQIARMLSGLEKVILKEKPAAVLVHGDTNSTLAGALAAAKQKIPVIHIESGARCGNKKCPEELNRIMVDHLASVNFAFDRESEQNLRREGLTNNLYNYTNTIYEACIKNLKFARKSRILKKTGLKSKKYILCTIHRAENTQDQKCLEKIFKALNFLAQDNFILFPIHPGTLRRARSMVKHKHPNIITSAPLGYLDFLEALAHASAVISDSGGVVDESIILNVPMAILRNETERNLIVKAGKAVLIKPYWQEKALFLRLSRFLTPKNLTKMKTKKFLIEYKVGKKIAKVIKSEICDRK